MFPAPVYLSMLASLALLQASIAVGPASMSLPELATALTRAGMPTDCSPALRERAALVSLHGRSPEASRRTLGEALGVAFVPQGQGWRMVVDASVRSHDARLLAAYAAQAARVAADWAEAERKARGGLGFEAFAEQADAQVTALADGPQAGVRAAARIGSTIASARRSQPNAWTATAILRDGAFVRRAVVEGLAVQTLPATQVEATTGVPLAAYLPEANKAGMGLLTGGQLVTTAKFDPLEATLTVSSALVADGKSVAGARRFETASGTPVGGLRDGYELTLNLEPEPMDATLAALDPAYPSSFLPAATLPERPVLHPAPWTLSSGLERLCADGQQLVMALSPRFEPTPRFVSGGTRPPDLSFRSAFDPRPEGDPEYGYYADRGLDRSAVDVRRKRVAHRRRPWRVVDRDGVWLVVNPYGFLDRARPISPVPFLKAEHVLREQGGGAIPEAPTIATARRIGALFPWPDLGAYHDVLGYRDLDLEGDGALLGMLWRLDGALPTAQGAFWRDLRVHRAATVETPQGSITLRLDGDESAPNVVGGYLFPGTATGGADLGYVRFDGRGTVMP